MSETDYLPPWHRDYILVGMGVEAEFDYAEDPSPFDGRLGHCYRLAASAFIHSHDDRPAGYPEPITLVHGSWHGPGAPDRIDHAWVLLDDGRVWEPITACIFDRERFYSYTRAEDTMHYQGVVALMNMLQHEHFGPWDDEPVSGNGGA
jgi:hypothetical protein